MFNRFFFKFQYGAYLGKIESKIFGKTSSRSMCHNVQNDTPTLRANGKANAAIT